MRITPLKEALLGSRVALDPDQMDATWYGSLLMSSATPARGPRQPPAVSSSGDRAAKQRAKADETPDRAAVAAARLTEAGRGPEFCVRHTPPPAPAAEAVLSSQGGPAVGMSDAPVPNGHQNSPAAVGGEAEPPEEVAAPDKAAAVSSAMGVEHEKLLPSAQAAADGALLPADGMRAAGPPGQTLPETASQILKASRIQQQLNEPSNVTTGLKAPTQDAEQNLGVTAQTGAAPSTDASANQKLLWEQPDQAAAKITPADRARGAAAGLTLRIKSLQQQSEATAAAGRSRPAVLPLPAKPRWERLDQPLAAATLGGGATLARCASDAAQQAERNHALVSELKHHLQMSGARRSAGPIARVRYLPGFCLIPSPSLYLSSPD